MKKTLFLTLACCFAVLFSSFAFGDPITWTEIGDAGELPATAQVIDVFPGELVMIQGSLFQNPFEPGEVDMYQINIFDPANFSASTVEDLLLISDPQLFLFDSNGLGVYMNDDGMGTGSQSVLPASHPLGPASAGLYYLAIVFWDNQPFSISGSIFENLLDVAGPSVGGLDPISFWNDDVLLPNFDVATGYQIALMGVSPVPEPGAWLLLSGGLLTLFGRDLRRRHRKRRIKA